MVFTEKQLSREIKYKGKIVTVCLDEVELINGKKTLREECLHPGGVAILPLLDNGEVICVRQHRYAYNADLIEIPAGKLEAGEDPLECGIRELSEETGYTASEIIPLGCAYPSPGYVNEKLYLYLARGLKEGDSHPDEGELLEMFTMPFEELLRRVMADEIHDAKTVIATLKTKIILDGERK
ncbi:MAG: NUDIX hydrolase [Clostridia bacterium]|nr:NUDIX hydrolase [Clostridia bacterium]